MCSQFSLKGQSKSLLESVDSTIIKARGLEDKVAMLLEECNWSQQIGGQVDVFLIQIDTGGYLFGKVYEHILDCDNVRLIF